MHIHKRNNTYIYRRRIPKELKSHINLTEFHRALSPDKQLAKLIASRYDLLFNRLIASVQVSVDITNLIYELDLDIATGKVKTNIYEEFLKSKEDISLNGYRQYKHQLEFFEFILPDDFSKVSYATVDALKEKISNLPKGNIGKYKSMSLKELVSADIDEKDKLSIKSQNDYLTTFKALHKFGLERDYTAQTITVKSFNNTTSSRNQREALSTDEVAMLCTHSDTRIADMAKILYYTGMRLSEVYKCSISTVDGVECFNLMDKAIDLKTSSSYRVIPVHSELSEKITEILQNATSIKDKEHTRTFSKLLNGSGKVLYSLRHSFATELASRGTDTGIISELLGHTHEGMTMSRYVKGLPMKMLKNAVDTL